MFKWISWKITLSLYPALAHQFRMNSCILKVHWLGICFLHPTTCTPCTIALHPGKLPATPRRNWLSDSAVVQLTYSYTLWEISSEKWQVSAKVHTIHMYIVTHNAVSCIVIEKFSLLLIFLMLTTTWVTLKMLTIWIIQRSTAPLYMWKQRICSLTDKLISFQI